VAPSGGVTTLDHPAGDRESLGTTGCCPSDLGRSRRANRDLTRHGTLAPEDHYYLQEKAEKKDDEVLSGDGVEVRSPAARHAWDVEISSARHKARLRTPRNEGPTPQRAMDACVHRSSERSAVTRRRSGGNTGDPSDRTRKSPQPGAAGVMTATAAVEREERAVEPTRPAVRRGKRNG